MKALNVEDLEARVRRNMIMREKEAVADPSAPPMGFKLHERIMNCLDAKDQVHWKKKWLQKQRESK